MNGLFIENKKVDGKIELWEVYQKDEKIAIFIGEKGKRNAKLFCNLMLQLLEVDNYSILDYNKKES